MQVEDLVEDQDELTTTQKLTITSDKIYNIDEDDIETLEFDSDEYDDVDDNDCEHDQEFNLCEAMTLARLMADSSSRFQDLPQMLVDQFNNQQSMSR